MFQEPVVLTGAGLRRAEEELAYLRSVRRREVADLLRQARECGDPAGENAEMEQARWEQGLVEDRIAALTVLLETAEVLDSAGVPTDRVGLGSLVTVRDLDAGEEWELALVSHLEVDPEEDRISYQCPVGQALMGKGVAETAVTHTPAGQVRYEVLSIRRPEEDVTQPSPRPSDHPDEIVPGPAGLGEL